jgi:hypothetical protein
MSSQYTALVADLTAKLAARPELTEANTNELQGWKVEIEEIAVRGCVSCLRLF